MWVDWLCQDHTPQDNMTQHNTTQHKTRQDNNTRRGRDETRQDKDRTRARQEEAREKARERRQASRLEGASEREKTRVKPAAWIAANFARKRREEKRSGVSSFTKIETGRRIQIECQRPTKTETERNRARQAEQERTAHMQTSRRIHDTGNQAEREEHTGSQSKQVPCSQKKSNRK